MPVLLKLSLVILLTTILAGPGLASSSATKAAKRDWLFEPLSGLVQAIVGSIFDIRDQVQPQETNAIDTSALGLYAAYAGAAYNITAASWDCGSECNYPGTEGTVVEYHWDAPVITNNGYIARNPSRKLIIVSFRGSAVLGDWVEDFTESPVYWPESVAGSTVVLGVLGGYLVSSKHILQGTAKLAEAYPDYAIVAVGHSLGGSRASMFVADFVLRHPQYAARVQMYTYGQAKSGNRVFADFMNGLGVPIYRAVNRGDIVPHLPLTDTRLVHFGTEVWTTLSNRIVACPNIDYSRCSNSLPLPAYSTSDHSTYFGL